jgi:hypothetical protein
MPQVLNNRVVGIPKGAMYVRIQGEEIKVAAAATAKCATQKTPRELAHLCRPRTRSIALRSAGRALPRARTSARYCNRCIFGGARLRMV